MSSHPCELCGHNDRYAVRLGVVEWLPEYGTGWTVMHRCSNHADCRKRYEATGEPWPVRDAYAEVRV